VDGCVGESAVTFRQGVYLTEDTADSAAAPQSLAGRKGGREGLRLGNERPGSAVGKTGENE